MTSVTLFNATGWSQRATDTIQLWEGAPVRGTVTAMTPDSVQVEVSGNARTIPTNQIKQILFGSEPPLLRSGREAALNGQWDVSLNSLQRVDEGAIKDDFTLQDLQFYRAFCAGQLALQGVKEDGAAVKNLMAFANEHRDSWHIYATAELLGDLAQKLNKLDLATRFYGKLSNSAMEETRMRGNLLEADALRMQGPEQFSQAIDKFDAVLNLKSSGAASDRLRNLAIIGKAHCTSQPDALASSVEAIEKIIDDNDVADVELFARAYVALGSCYQRLDNIPEAVLALLHVDLLFSGNADAHAESLYRLAQLWPQLGKPDRASDARNRLRAQYGDSRWAKLP